MKPSLKIIIMLAIACLIGIIIYISTKGSEDNTHVDVPEPEPINLTVLLDLSDRLTREMTPTQAARDSAIVDYLVDKFISITTKDNKISERKDCMRIMFYPEPTISNIANLAENLDVDLSKAELKDKKGLLKNMKSNFNSSLTEIYESTLKSHNWIGSDLWGFFSFGDVDKYCIKDGYRNVIILLTDGYLFHTSNKIKEGNNYSYILPQTLSQAEAQLIVKRKDLNNIEVLVLEVNPYDPKVSQRLNGMLQNWFENMGVTKIDIANTALPSNTKKVIDKFLD